VERSAIFSQSEISMEILTFGLMLALAWFAGQLFGRLLTLGYDYFGSIRIRCE
jgi:hypothetical protein